MRLQTMLQLLSVFRLALHYSSAAEDTRKSLCCGFEAGPCNFKTASTFGETANDFVKAGPERFKNPITGVPPSPDKAFFATYMKPKEKSYMEAVVGPMPNKMIIKFQYFKAVPEISIKAGCDIGGLMYDTGTKVKKTVFRQWYQGSVECPAGSSKVIFYTENTGIYEGGAGIDNIVVYDANGNKIC